MGRTVLIVEDDKSVARLLADVLEADGYQALVEADGEWGLRTFQHKDVDLVITDVLLPKLVGFDLVEQLRALEKWDGKLPQVSGGAVPFVSLEQFSAKAQ